MVPAVLERGKGKKEESIERFLPVVPACLNAGGKNQIGKGKKKRKVYLKNSLIAAVRKGEEGFREGGGGNRG